jgi:phage-related protein
LAIGHATGAKNGSESLGIAINDIRRNCTSFLHGLEDCIVVLHGFTKKSQATPANELATAKRRLDIFRRNTP